MLILKNLKKKQDAIFMVDVFHHLHRPNLAIKNLKKSLKKNGKIIIFEPYVSPVSFILYLITSFAGPKEKMGLFKKIDFSLKKRDLRDNFAFVMQPQKFFGKKIIKKDVVEIAYIAEYFFIFTGGVHFHNLQKLIPNFVYSFMQKIDNFLNNSKILLLKKFFSTKILIVIE
jgi:SAM-dependent methyltransferase